MSDDPVLERIKPFAQRLIQFPRDMNAYSNLVVRLQLVENPNACRELLQSYSLYPHISAPVLKRLVQLEDDNPETLLNAAHAFYAFGEDAEADALVDRVLAGNAENIGAWEMKAMLCASPDEKRAIYERILKIEPGNRMAVDNLIVLGKPR